MKNELPRRLANKIGENDMIENNPTNVEAAFGMLLPRLISGEADVSELDIETGDGN